MNEMFMPNSGTWQSWWYF